MANAETSIIGAVTSSFELRYSLVIRVSSLDILWFHFLVNVQEPQIAL